MSQLPGEKLLDKVEVLPNADDNHFVLFGHSLPFPTFDTAEQLVEEMIRLGLLKDNEIVSSVLQGSPKAKSKRAVQRHFIRTTGTTSKQLQQISRAQQAVRLLKQGEKPADAAANAGFTDQSHLSRSLKKIMDSAPSDVDDIHKL
jgi:methylphosphotriester-DNA--protein-cysteine methyltransferase